MNLSTLFFIKIMYIKYLILQNPGHNRVYYKYSNKLALAELKISCSKLSINTHSHKIEEIQGIRYLSFQSESVLKNSDLLIVSKLSFIFALFEQTENNLLKPIKLGFENYLDEKISSILKYQGKTNELFTKMMLNIAVIIGDFNDNSINILDPICGKGTTLFEASIFGYNAYGVEINKKSTHEAITFFKKFLEKEKIKHKQEKKQVFGTNKNNSVMIEEFEYGISKDDFKKNPLSLGIITGNTQELDKYFPSENFHAIVGDLPYGIQHSNKDKGIKNSPTRNPIELINESISAWYKVLKTAGAVVLSWNSLVMKKEEIAKVFEDNQFEVLTDEPFNSLEHRVDNSIRRDVFIAKKS